MNMNLGEEHVIMLEEKTEGWAAGLQLAVLSIQGKDIEARDRFLKDFRGTKTVIIEYLSEEIFGQLPEDIRHFLIQTSILDRFNSSLCDFILGRNDSSEVINKIYKSNIFITLLDEQGQWFRYHALFRDILKAGLVEEQGYVLHKKASNWFENHELYEESIYHAIAAESFSDLERLLSKTAWTHIQRGEIKALSAWIQVLPDERIDRNHEMKMYRAWCLLLTGNGKEAGE